MDDALLSYYNRELAYVRKLGAEFAERHPKIAGRLRLDKDTVEDPHVSRLIESFAFLTARIRHKLDDSFPELTEALMGVLYPDYHAPIPSLSIARIQPIPERLEPRLVPRHTLLFTQSNPLGTCYYRTCYSTEVYPLTVANAQFSAQPFKAPTPPGMAQSAGQAVLRLSLRCAPGTTLAELAPPQLRFYLNGQPQLSFRLYEFLLQHATAIAIAEHPRDPDTVFLPPSALRPYGLGETENALPGDGRCSSAHRLLTEYFAFPEKFLFVQLERLAEVWRGRGEQTHIYIYFSRSHPELVQGVGADTLLLGCTPIVNLFEQRLESIPAAELGYETKLRVDATHTRCADIHTLRQVYARDADGRRIELQPFYGSHRTERAGGEPLYWHARRELSQRFDGRVSRGSDLWLSLVDRDFQITAPDSNWIIGGEALCTNRDLPDKLPFGPGEPQLQFNEGGAGLQLACVTPPTPTVQPQLDDATRWQLITQLSLQHFSGDDGLGVLKETLRLYDFRQVPETRSIIDGIVGLRTELTTARVTRDGRAAICQGTRLELELDEHYYSGTGLYLFTAILSEFFAHYCTVNTFVQLNVRVRQRPGSVISWPARSGNQTLI